MTTAEPSGLAHSRVHGRRSHGRPKFLHLRPTRDLTMRRLASLTGRERIAFNGYYQRKDDPSKPQFYRHAALRPHFSQVDGEWFCEVVPDYFYTEDGYSEYKYAGRTRCVPRAFRERA